MKGVLKGGRWGSNRKFCTLTPARGPGVGGHPRVAQPAAAAKPAEEVTKRGGGERECESHALLSAELAGSLFTSRPRAPDIPREVYAGGSLQGWPSPVRVTSDSSPGLPQSRPRGGPRGRRFWPAFSGCAYSNAAIKSLLPLPERRVSIVLENGTGTCSKSRGLRLTCLLPSPKPGWRVCNRFRFRTRCGWVLGFVWVSVGCLGPASTTSLFLNVMQIEATGLTQEIMVRLKG